MAADAQSAWMLNALPMSLRWKLQRLSRMGPGEILYRARQTLRSQMERAGLGLATPAKPAGEAGRPWVAELPRNVNSTAIIQAAERVLAGYFDIFAMHGVHLGFPPSWNRDPKTGTLAPLVFGKALNYRDERLVGDIKYLWEPNRHVELVTLAQAWHLTADTRYLQACRTLLDSWMTQCPYPRGVHWTSSLEHGVRLVNWAFAWHLLGGEGSPLFVDADGQSFRQRWLDCIYRHCHFIASHFSRFSSANNHLLGEYMGLFVASATWSYWNESARWRAVARRGFEREALLQNSNDGVNREQAIWYHHEVSDMMLICGLVARANGCDFGTQYWQRLERMLEFVASLMDVNGGMPMIGDSDDAVMLRLDPAREFNVYRSLLATGALLFERGDFKAKAGVLDDKTCWLLGDAAAERFQALETARKPPRRAFPQGGYYILGSDFDTAQEVRIVADAAPLGYLSIAAHGHADALAFTLSAGGRELLIDPGTYAYHTQERWRDYFKGTAAHNTVRVDRVDQSVSGGKFMWLKHAQARCLSFEVTEQGQVWQAEHDGYLRLADPVRHRRQLHYQTARRALSVIDEIEAKGAHELEVFWHFAAECTVEVLAPDLALVRNGSVALRIACAGPLELRTGSDEPLLGWMSRRFDEKVPSPTLRILHRSSGCCRIETRFELLSS